MGEREVSRGTKARQRNSVHTVSAFIFTIQQRARLIPPVRAAMVVSVPGRRHGVAPSAWVVVMTVPVMSVSMAVVVPTVTVAVSVSVPVRWVIVRVGVVTVVVRAVVRAVVRGVARTVWVRRV